MNELVIYRLFYWFKMAKIDIDYFDTNVNSLVDKKAKNVAKSIDLFESELKSRLGNEFNVIFADFSSEKIYAIQSVMNKMFLMSDEQALEVEKELELIKIN